MANPNAPFGLRAVKMFGGGMPARESQYSIADQYGTSIFMGDPVLATGTGTNIGIAVAGTGNKITGVFNGCKYRNALGDTIWSEMWTTGTPTYNAEGAVAFVYDDPWTEYEVMFNTLAAADVRALANLVSGAGNAGNKLSGWSAVNPPGAGENQIKILSLPTSEIGQGGIQNAYGVFAVARILIAQHEFASGTIVGL